MNQVTPLSARQGAKDSFSRLNAVEKRVTDVEQTLSKVLMAINQVLGQLGKNLDEVAETVEALVNLTGPEQVAQAIAEIRATKLRQNADQTKAKVAEMVANGTLVKAEAVTGEKSLIVGREVQADGAEIPPGYAAVRFTQLKPDYREKLTGKKVGDTMDTESGGKFTVNEVYEFVPPPEQAAAPVEAAPTADASTGTAEAETLPPSAPEVAAAAPVAAEPPTTPPAQA